MFFLSGRGKGESEVPGGEGFHFLLKIPGGEGGFQEGPRGREGVCGELGNLGGGGAKYFFSGRNVQGIEETCQNDFLDFPEGHRHTN